MLSHDEATDSRYTVPREEEGDKQVSPTASLRASVLFFRAFNSTMARTNKLLDQILRGGADANIPFSGMAQLLKRLGFQERIKGSHHIFFRDGIAEILNLQPQSGKCKPYQVKQVRNVIINYRLAGDADA
ncbi:MAG TPA: type II toxin-antitoxin system HicA family toxin [Candidatus Acidoferrum sp.]|nr:type II toxin-antitoxin system HicA family toxin [Candidatus Acidoferrum sp.]